MYTKLLLVLTYTPVVCESKISVLYASFESVGATALYQLLPLEATLWTLPLPASTAWSDTCPRLWLPKQFQVCYSISSLPTRLLPSQSHTQQESWLRTLPETSGHLGNTPCSPVLLLNQPVYTTLYISSGSISFSSDTSNVSQQLSFHQTLLPF